MGPALIGVSVAQVSLMINSQIASWLGEGAVSTLVYADRLMELPTALLGVALGVVLTPQLAAARAQADAAVFSTLLDWGLRLALLLALPCAVALVVFAQPLVAVLFHRGAFGAQAVGATGAAVMGYGVGLMGIVGVKVLAPAYYAQQDMRTPMRVALVALVLTQVLNALTVRWLGVCALALSIGLAASANAGLLLRGLRQRGSYAPQPGWRGFFVRVGAANLALGGALVLARRIDWLVLGRHEGERALAMAAVLMGVAVGYFGLLRWLGVDWRALMRKSERGTRLGA